MSPRPAALSLIAGWADATAMLQAHVFAGAMSGNTVLLGIAAGRGDWRAAATPALAVASFFAGTLLARGLTRWRGTPVPAILLSAALVLAAAAPGVMPRAVFLLSAAMALLNAASTRYGDLSLNTSFITGDTVKLWDAVAGRLLRDRGRQQPEGTLAEVSAVWLGYAAGAALGALATLALAGQGGAVTRGWDLPLLPAAVALPLTLLLK